MKLIILLPNGNKLAVDNETISAQVMSLVTDQSESKSTQKETKTFPKIHESQVKRQRKSGYRSTSYTAEEDVIIMDMTKSTRQIAKLLKRTNGAISVRRSTLKKRAVNIAKDNAHRLFAGQARVAQPVVNN